MDKFLLKKIFYNKYFDKQGVALFGERGSGKTLELVKEAHINNGIIVIGDTDNATSRLKDLKIEESAVKILNYQAFVKGFTIGINTPIYIDELDLYQKRYAVPKSEWKKICGYNSTIEFDYYDRKINED